jgi:hypothetical protein
MKLARKLREEPGVRYRDCAILESAVRAADTRLPLYTITGRFPKGAGTHPLLASAQAAMEWIDAQHTAEKVHASC